MKLSRLMCLFACICMPCFSGCTAIRQTIGLRVKLAKLPIDAMAASLPPLPGRQPGVAPGEHAKMIATFTQPNGKVLTTEGKGKGRVAWTELKVATTLVTAKKGTLTLAQDPRGTEGKVGRVDITVPSHPGVTAGFDVPVRYDFGYTANYSGSSGSDGQAGTDGVDGSSGSDGSTDPANPTPGGSGGSGTNGGSGSGGGDGGNGSDIQVDVTLEPGAARPLLQVRVTVQGTSNSTYYLVDPDGGSLTLYADGGSGGSGGKGGRGGSGGSGGSGSPPGSSGTSGVAGTDGSSGNPGSAGSIAVSYDASAQPYLKVIVARGAARATYSEQFVGPLW